MTNQEGKLFYATCMEYFIDLASLEDEFRGLEKIDTNSENKIVR